MWVAVRQYDHVAFAGPMPLAFPEGDPARPSGDDVEDDQALRAGPLRVRELGGRGWGLVGPPLCELGAEEDRSIQPEPAERDIEGRQRQAMPLFMDVHNSLPEGATAADVAEAHRADLKTQEKYGVQYLNYWADAAGGKVFCLVEAPDADTAHVVHREAHGLVADEIYPVVQG